MVIFKKNSNFVNLYRPPAAWLRRSIHRVPTHTAMKNYTHLRSYDSTYISDLNTLIEHSIAGLPFSIAHPLDMLYRELESENYDKAKDHALDLIEVAVQWLSMFMFVRLINHNALPPKSLERLQRVVKKIDDKRALSLGDWLSEIFIPIAQSAKEAMPKDELTISIHNNLFKGKNCTLLGSKSEPSVVNTRNAYKGHGTILSLELYRGVVYTLEPHIHTLLRAAAPLCAGDYISVGKEERGYYTLSHKGSTPNAKSYIAADDEDAVPANVGHYYATIDTTEGRTKYDLHPLIYCSEEGYVYIFQTLGEDNIAYISSNIHAERTTHDIYNDDFDRLLQNIDKSFDISREKNWDEIQRAMADESKRYLARVYSEKKYNRELFIDHRHLSTMLGEFYASELPLLPLLGEAGQGKTNQLCYWTEEHLANNDGVMIFSSSDFSVMSIEERLRSIFGYGPRRDIAKIVNMMHERAVERGSVIYLLFDAINECLSYANEDSEAGPLALYNAIHRLFIAPRYSNIKIVFTCRSYTWKSLFSHIVERDKELLYIGEDDSTTTVRGFNREELEVAYKVYQDLYQMGTPFEELSLVAQVRLKDPLILKIASVNFLSKSLPSDTDSYTSIALFKRMFSDMERSYAGRKQGQILREIGNYILDSYLSGKAIDSIPEDMLHHAYNDSASPLHTLARLIYKVDGTTIAYGELINRPERPILRLVDIVGRSSKSLQFIYERLLEYILAEVLYARGRHGREAYKAIPAEVYIDAIRRGATNVVFMGALRNTLILDLQHTHDYSTLLTLIRDHSDNYEAAALVSDVCNTLIRENYESEIFTLIGHMLDANIEDGESVTTELNALIKKIDNGEASSEIIAKHRELHGRLEPIIRLRQMALVNTFNGLLLSEYFNESLYTQQPLQLVWRLMCDPIKEIGNDACLYAYYLKNHKHTLEYTPLRRNITEYLVGQMYDDIKSRRLLTNALVGRHRKRMVIFLESAVRITTLLIIDSLLEGSTEGRARVTQMLEQIRDIMCYISGRWALIRLTIPFLQLIMRTQITFQKVYVNNAIEYQCFWDDSVIKPRSEDGTWDRAALREATKFLGYSIAPAEERAKLDEAFKAFHSKIKSCYAIGDSFSYFVIERMLIVMGTSNWESVRELYHDHLFPICHSSEWCDYSQMSLLYNLFHTGLNQPLKRDILDLYAREAEDWTVRCRGEFKARNSHNANPRGLYKRNVLDWYGALYCTHSGDNTPLKGDERCVPLFYKLIDQAIAERDKELLFHLLENIAELVTDWGFIKTALALLHHTLSRIETQEMIDEIDSIKVARDGIYTNDIVSVVGSILSTAKNYHPTEVDIFLKRDIAGLSFPAISQYREEILNYNPSGESLSDLLTHKFGKFVVWSLIHEPEVNAFAARAVEGAVGAKSCFEWYDKTVRLAFRSLFGLNV